MNKVEIDLDIVRELGLDGYLLLKYIDAMVETNKHLGLNYMDGKYWVGQSISGFMKVHNLFSRGKVINALKRLVNDGLIMKLNAKDNSGNWLDNIYTITEKGKELLINEK